MTSQDSGWCPHPDIGAYITSSVPLIYRATFTIPVISLMSFMAHHIFLDLKYNGSKNNQTRCPTSKLGHRLSIVRYSPTCPPLAARRPVPHMCVEHSPSLCISLKSVSTVSQWEKCDLLWMRHYRHVLFSRDIRLINFSCATFEEEYHCVVVTTRHHRPPEVILGLCSYLISSASLFDICRRPWIVIHATFSLGCILVEFYMGVALYQTCNDLEHLAMMERVMGKMPDHFAHVGTRSKPEFFAEGKFAWRKSLRKDDYQLLALFRFIWMLDGCPLLTINSLHRR